MWSQPHSISCSSCPGRRESAKLEGIGKIQSAIGDPYRYYWDIRPAFYRLSYSDPLYMSYINIIYRYFLRTLFI